MTQSPRGKNVMTFLVFLAISAVLWIVMCLNEEASRDLRCKFSIVQVPDTMVRITEVPPYMNVSVRAKGSAMLKYLFSDDLEMKVNYNNYVKGNHLLLNQADLKALFRQRFGTDVQLLSFNPDSLSVYFATDKGLKLPVKVDARVSAAPQFALLGAPRALTDSVMLYSIKDFPKSLSSLSTSPIVLNDMRSTQTLRVPIVTSPGMRAVPDSVDVLIEVEPLVSKSRMVDVQPINVPQGERLIPVPNQVAVYYMVPMSVYKSTDSNPKFVVQADYNSIREGNDKIAITLKSAPSMFLNVFLDTDSVEFIAER